MNEYVIANYTKIIRKYACYKSDEECLNELVNLIADPLKIDDREGEPYSLTKGDVSDIINRKENVPKVIKEGAIKVDFQSVVDGFEDILSRISEDKISSLIREIQALYSNKYDFNYSLPIEKSFNKYIKKPNVFLTNTFLQCLSHENKINYLHSYAVGKPPKSLDTRNLLLPINIFLEYLIKKVGYIDSKYLCHLLSFLQCHFLNR